MRERQPIASSPSSPETEFIAGRLASYGLTRASMGRRREPRGKPDAWLRAERDLGFWHLQRPLYPQAAGPGRSDQCPGRTISGDVRRRAPRADGEVPRAAEGGRNAG